MKNLRKTKKELIDELVASRHRVAELETPRRQLGRRTGRRSTLPLPHGCRGRRVGDATAHLQGRRKERLIDHGDLFTVFADHLPACLFIKNDKSILQYVNKYMIMHFHADKWIGLTVERHLPLDLATAILADDSRALTEGPLFRDQWIPDKTGETRCFQSCKFPIKREDAPTLLGGIAIDITRHKQGDEALRRLKDQLELRVLERTEELTRTNQLLHEEIAKRKASENALVEAGEQYRILTERATRLEEHYLSLLNSSTDAIVIYDLARRVIYLNPSHTKIFGWTLEEARGHRIPVVPPWDTEMNNEIVDRILKDGIPCTAHETRRYTKDRRVLDVSMSASPCYDHEGHPSGILLIYRDISARKNTEAALNRMSNVFRDAINPIIIRDLGGIIVDLNEAAEKTYGWQREELVGKSIKVLIPEDLHAQVDAMQERCKKGKKVRNVESVRCTRGGKNIPVLMSLSLLTDNKGEGVGIASITQSLADLKRTEAKLRDRTKALEQTNQDLEQFAYVAAHDLREPLLAVAGYLKVLHRRHSGELDADGASMVERALDTTVRMDALIQDLLVYSRLGTQPETLEPTDFNVILVRALADLNSAIEKTCATIYYDPLPTIMANPSQMAQLFQNLIGNAIKFVRDRCPVIKLAALKREKEWVFSVQDNGIGIPSSGLSRIFLPFERFHNREEFPGTGIGLANCKKIVERHGGRIWVDSIPGEGSFFCFSLPDPGPGGMKSDDGKR